MRKFTKILISAIGAALLGLAVFLYLSQGPSAEKIPAVRGEADPSNEGKSVIVRGALSWSGTVSDGLFGITVDSPLLVRNVEMVQWYKNVNDEVYLTLSSKKLPDFEFEGKKYVNPEFPTDITYEVFTSPVTIGNGPLKLSDDLVRQLAGGANTAYSSAKTVKIQDLSFSIGEALGLDKYDGYYATPGEEWKPGDISKCIL